MTKTRSNGREGSELLMGERNVIYDCVENDNRLQVQLIDGRLDELWITDPLDKGWTIIGAGDLKAALSKVGLTIVREG